MGRKTSIAEPTQLHPSNADAGRAPSLEQAVPTLGSVIREMRRCRSVSQKALALDAQIDQSVLAAIESGRRAPPRDGVMQRITSALHPTDRELLELERGRLASRLSKVLEEQPPAIRAAIVEIALVVVRTMNQERPGR